MSINLNLHKVNLIVGIDQTGAVLNAKRAKALPIVLLIKQGKTWNLTAFQYQSTKHLYLNDLCLNDLSIHIKKACQTDFKKHYTMICVDTVLGLPKIFQIQNTSCLDQMQSYFSKTQTISGYGKLHANEFFQNVLKQTLNNLTVIPERKVEKTFGANSVFTSIPFQKNIQTGSFRVWKNLSRWPSSSYQLWPFEYKPIQSGVPVILEGYPSLAWKILNQSSRQEKDFSNLKSHFINSVENIDALKTYKADHKDAAMLALLTLYMIQNKQSFHPKKVTLEGSILGSLLTKES